MNEQKNWLFYISEKRQRFALRQGEWYENHEMGWWDIEELQEALVLKEKTKQESLPFDDGE